MKLSDIIKNEKDRVFIVNPECFIIFTGDSLTDERPFIRIGNWQDLPVEIIPLIENIIISDLYVGNPAHEQFNIDVKYLPKNRYIGRNQIISKFLNYQKIFGLNLDNANFINAEKDIPSISKGKAISDRESFIGIFYKDGNFIIDHNSSELLNLKKITEVIQNEYRTHDIISANSKKTDRYSGTGFVIIDNNPVFYENNNFITYLFPRTYSRQFNELGISPRNISAVIHPSSNYMSITKFLKWKHLSQGKLSIFTDYNEKLKSLKNLFPGMTLKTENFHGMKIDNNSGISVSNIPGSFNMLLKSDHSRDRINYIFIKALKDIEISLKVPHDFILVNYSVFEDASIILNQQKKPVLVHDDGNINIKKMSRLKNIIILQNIQYVLRRHSDENSVHNVYQKLLSKETLSILENEEYEKLKSLQTGDLEIFNVISYLQFQFFISTSRNKSEKIKKIIPSLRYNLEKNSSEFTITLHLTGNGIFQSINRVPAPDMQFAAPDILAEEELLEFSEHEFIRQISDDRKRLYALLDLYSTSSIYSREIKELKAAIEERKHIFNEEFISAESRKKLNLDNLFESSTVQEDTETAQDSVVNKIISLFGKSGKENYGKYQSGSITDSDDSLSEYSMKKKNEGYGNKNKGLNSSVSPKNSLNGTGKSRPKGFSGFFRKKTDHEAEETYDISENNKHDKVSTSASIRNAGFSHTVTGGSKSKTGFKKVITALFMVLAALLFLFISGFFIKTAYEKHVEAEKFRLENEAAEALAEQERIKKEAEEKKHAELREIYSIHVSNQDIFLYANEIAVKNGYDPFPNTEFRHKNPNWIFPDNKFIFPDGQTVTVVAGDTLWGLCEKKLMEIYYQFYDILNTVEKNFNQNGTYDKEEMDKAEKLIHTPRQLKDFKKLSGILKSDDTE